MLKSSLKRPAKWFLVPKTETQLKQDNKIVVSTKVPVIILNQMEVPHQNSDLQRKLIKSNHMTQTPLSQIINTKRVNGTVRFLYCEERTLWRFMEWTIQVFWVQPCPHSKLSGVLNRPIQWAKYVTLKVERGTVDFHPGNSKEQTKEKPCW